MLEPRKALAASLAVRTAVPGNPNESELLSCSEKRKPPSTLTRASISSPSSRPSSAATL